MADQQGGIEWYLELQARLEGAVQMSRALTKVQADALKTDAALKKTEKATGALGAVAGKVGGAFASFGKATLAHLAALATFDGLQRLGGAIVNVAQNALEAAGQAERMRLSFAHLLGDEPADELLGFLDELAKVTEFTDGALKDMAADLIKVGFAGDGLDRALAATIDFAAISKDKAAGAANAIALLSKVQLKGGVTERELVGAGLSPKKFYEGLAADLGLGIKTVEKRVSEGKVRVEDLLEALYEDLSRKTGKPLGGAGVSMSTTFLAQVEKAKDIIPNLFEELEKSGGLKGVTAGLSRLVEVLAPDSPTGKKIIDGATRLLDRFGQLVTTIDWEKWSGRIETAFDLLGTVMEFVASEVGRLGTMFDNLVGIGNFVGDMAYEVVQAFGDLFTTWVDLGSQIWKGIKEGILSGIPNVIDSVKFLGKEAVGGLKGILGIQSPSTVFAELGMQTSMGFILGVEDALPDVQSAIAGAFSPLALAPLELGSIPAAAAAAAPMAPAFAMGAGGGGGNSFVAEITVNIGSVAGDDAAAKRVGQQVEFGARQALEAIFEQWAAEGEAS